MIDSETSINYSDIQYSESAIDQYVGLLFDHANEWGVESLGDTRRAIALAFRIQGLVGNGGLRYFYESTTEPRSSVWAYHQLGLDGAAAALERSLSVFPEGLFERDHALAVSWMGDYYEQFESLWNDLEGIIMDLEPFGSGSNASLLITKTREFIGRHKDEFNFS